GQSAASNYVAFGGVGTIVSNCYFHGWTSPYFSMGTGNTVAGSSTVTNYVPYSWSQSPTSAWPTVGNSNPKMAIGYGGLPEQNNGPNTLTITCTSNCGGAGVWTITTNACLSSCAYGPVTTCTGCTIQIGQDYFTVTG